MSASKNPPQTRGSRSHNGGGHASSNELRAKLLALFDADRALRESERNLLSTQDQETLVDVLCRAREEAKTLSDPYETGLRLERLADLYAQVPTRASIEALVALLDEEDPGVRVQAADALVDLAAERYALIVRVIDQRLQQRDSGFAMRELPWILVEIGEADTLELLGRFLAHPTGEVVASAVEALVSLALPESADMLEPLKDDDRIVELDPMDDDGDETVALGELVREAISALRPSGRKR